MTNSRPEENGGGPMRVVYITFGVFFGITILIFALAVTAAAVWTDGEFASVVAVIRDVMFILLALEGILIVLALVILIAQVARLVNLVQNEIKPILENTQETVTHAKGTVEFVGKNVSEPVITASKYFAAAGAFTREIFQLNRALTRNLANTPQPQETEPDNGDQA